MSGALIPLPSALLTAATATLKTTRAVAVWDGADTKSLDTALQHILLVAKNATYVGDSPNLTEYHAT